MNQAERSAVMAALQTIEAILQDVAPGHQDDLAQIRDAVSVLDKLGEPYKDNITEAIKNARGGDAPTEKKGYA